MSKVEGASAPREVQELRTKVQELQRQLGAERSDTANQAPPAQASSSRTEFDATHVPPPPPAPVNVASVYAATASSAAGSRHHGASAIA